MAQSNRKSFQNGGAYNNKERLLRVKEILEEETDATHGISLDRINDILADDQMNAPRTNRKSLYDDIDTLRSIRDFDISSPRGGETEYRVTEL